jgi:hypothetical protein
MAVVHNGVGVFTYKGYKGYKDGLQPESLADGNICEPFVARSMAVVQNGVGVFT